MNSEIFGMSIPLFILAIYLLRWVLPGLSQSRHWRCPERFRHSDRGAGSAHAPFEHISSSFEQF